MIGTLAALVSVGDDVRERELPSPYAPDRLVEWASLTKLVTADAVHALIAEGGTERTTPVSDILPLHLDARVTVGRVLSHTAGLPRVHAGMSAGVAGDPYADLTAEGLIETVDGSLSPWLIEDRFRWHNGAARDSGACLVIAPESELVVLTHALGAPPYAADREAWKRMRQHGET